MFIVNFDLYRSRHASGNKSADAGVITAFGSKFTRSPSAGRSPATRPGGRTATVTPADTLLLNKRVSKPMPRFGFRDIGPVKSGDSTDSVNSILSDVLTVSDSNSNILDYYDEHVTNSKKNEEISGKRDTHTMNLKNMLSVSDEHRDSHSRTSSRCDQVTVHGSTAPKSPTTISQASSGVTSSSNLVTAKLKTHTHQLPEPQVPAMRSFGARTETAISKTSPASVKTRPLSYSDSAASTSVTSFLPRSVTSNSSPFINLCPVTFKTVTNAAISKSSSNTPSPVDEKERESPKSINTLDSGLGSSLEGDKLRSGINSRNADVITHDSQFEAVGLSVDHHASKQDKLADLKQRLTNNIGEKKCAPVDLVIENKFMTAPVKNINNCEDDMKKSIIDESDKWLREKKNKMGTANKLQTGFILKPAIKLIANNKIIVKDQKPIFKEQLDSKNSVTNIESQQESDGVVTYSEARQKFASYERNRFGFPSGLQTPSAIPSPCTTTKLSKAPSDPGSRRTGNSPQSKLTRLHSEGSARPTNIRPTSLIKTPLLVTPVSNETVELSRPIQRKLEYTENSVGKEGDDVPCVDRVMHRKNSTEDVLVVSCFERSVRDAPVDHSPSHSDRDIEFNKKLNHKATIFQNILESPADQQVQAKLESFSLESPSFGKLNSKVLSPDSECSFEVLETPSDGLDDMDGNICSTVFNADCISQQSQSSVPPQEHSVNQQHSSQAEVHSDLINVSENYCNASFAKELEELTCSLENSSLVASLTAAVMTESLEESASQNSPATYIKDPSSFYKITASFNTSICSDSNNCSTPLYVTSETLTPVTIKSNDASGNQADIVVMENYLNNLTTSKRDDFTSLISTALSGDTMLQGYLPDREFSPIKNDKFNFNGNFAAAVGDDNIRTNNGYAQFTSTREVCSSLSTEVEAFCHDRDALNTNVMNTSSVFSETNSNSNRCSPALSRSKCNVNVSANSADIDHDFLIDDEISDQPDLTFAGDEMCGDQAECSFSTDGLSCRSRDFHLSYLTRENSNASSRRSAATGRPVVEDLSAGEGDDQGDDIVTSLFSDEGIFADDGNAPSPCQAVRRIGECVVINVKH